MSYYFYYEYYYYYFTVYILFSFITINPNSCVSCMAICSHEYAGYLYPQKIPNKGYLKFICVIIMVILKL